MCGAPCTVVMKYPKPSPPGIPKNCLGDQDKRQLVQLTLHQSTRLSSIHCNLPPSGLLHSHRKALTRRWHTLYKSKLCPVRFRGSIVPMLDIRVYCLAWYLSMSPISSYFSTRDLYEFLIALRIYIPFLC